MVPAEVQKFANWAEEVDKLFLAQYGASWDDLAGDIMPLYDFFVADTTAQHFVDWFANKHDLIKRKNW